MKSFTVSTGKKYQLVDITDEVKDKVKDMDEGICLVYLPHATASVVINENYDPNVCKDIINFLKEQIPEGEWLHDKVDNNGAAHIKSAILGPSEAIPIENGKLQLGRWQSLMLCEWDGPKERTVIIQVVD